MIQIKEKRVAKLRVGRTDGGFLVRVEGRGTVKLSPVFHQFVVQALDDASEHSSPSVVVDLDACDYLDSTFLGCLLNLNKRYNRLGDRRFHVAATLEKNRELLGPSNLHMVLDVKESCPAPVSEMLELDYPSLLGTDLGRHVLECHRHLAELDGPSKAAFRSIVEQLDNELEESLLGWSA